MRTPVLPSPRLIRLTSPDVRAYQEQQCDRVTWHPEFRDEPDRIVWEVDGRPHLLARNLRFATWSGYVATRPAEDQTSQSWQVHGGISFTGSLLEDDDMLPFDFPSHGEIYWIGFDCYHGYDRTPRFWDNPGGTNSCYRDVGTNSCYRDVWYVLDEINKLSAQIRALKGMKK